MIVALLIFDLLFLNNFDAAIFIKVKNTTGQNLCTDQVSTAFSVLSDNGAPVNCILDCIARGRKCLTVNVKFLAGKVECSFYGTMPSVKSAVGCRHYVVRRDRQVVVHSLGSLQVFVDGMRQMANLTPTTYGTKQIFSIDRKSILIAMMCTPFNYPNYGLIMWFDDELYVSNDLWKCTSVFGSDWSKPSFDDSSWPPPRHVSGVTSTFDPSPPESAKVIWSDAPSSPVYCRLTIYQ